ncbi:unnamed protein product [Gadus morhua 'NCC']
MMTMKNSGRSGTALQIKGRSILIHHSELCSLRPYQWLTGEVIEGLFHVAAHTFNVVDTVYIMNHYSAGGILFSDRTDYLVTVYQK